MINKLKNWKTKLGKWFWIILAITLLVGWRVIASANKSIKVSATKVTSGDIIETVSTSGTVKADQYSSLTFPTGGKVANVNVKVGDKVVKGQLIAALDTIPLSAAYQQALNNRRNTQAAVDSTHDSLKDISTETFAQKATRTAAEVANDNAWDGVRAAEDNLRNASIFAPFSGVIDTAIPSSPGINVGAAGSNYTLVNPDTVYFDAEVEETDLPNLSVGQKVNIKLDAYPDETFAGVLSNIGVVAFTSSTGGNAYHVRITLPKNENLKFRIGMQGDSDIIFGMVPSVIKVPSSAIFQDGGKNYVWGLKGGKVKKTEVEIGAVSNDETEVKSGLSDGDMVVNNPPANLKNGQMVSF